MRRLPRRHRRRGILLYVGLGLMMVLSIVGSALMYYATSSELNARMIYQGEVITNLAEAAVEEAFLNFERQLNEDRDSKIYKQLRDPLPPDSELELDPEYMSQITQAARKVAKDLYGIEAKDFQVSGLINRVQAFDIRGTPPDPIEKNAALTIKVMVTHNHFGSELTKVVIVSRPLKVVCCTIPVLAESTLFVNNLQVDTFAHWPSVLGYRLNDYPKEQPSLILDHGWAKYSTTNTKEDFVKVFEEEVMPKGAVPPGRVFINRGIVPITNGNRASGMLQKTFFSAESELLPEQFDFTLKQLKEFYENKASPVPTNPQGDVELDAEGDEDETEGEEPTDSTSSTAATTGTTAGDAIPDDGKIIIRYVGHGAELDVETCKDLIGKDVSGYRKWFQALVDDDWKQKRELHRMSGLDLFGRVEEKEQGGVFEESGGNIFQRIWRGIKKITKKIMEKLYSQYHIKISPTVVYGDVLRTYFSVRDYVETKWWDKIKNTAKLSGNERVLPFFPPGFLDGKDENTPLTLEGLPASWDEDTRKKWADLPEDIRKPRFFKYLNDLMFSDFRYNLTDPDWKMALDNLPSRTIFRPYNQGLVEFLAPPAESKVRGVFSALTQKGVFFMRNIIDKQIPDEAFKGGYEDAFEGPLTEFNPFLYYVKATEYISSLNDPRINPKDPRHNVFRRKFFDEKEGTLNLEGVIYITGTEPLQLGNVKYKGKAIIITFGPVVFTGFLAKSQDSGDDPEKNDLLTIISLGGIDIQTTDRIDAMLYSYIYPIQATNRQKIHVFGGLGCNDMQLRFLPEGGNINFDWTYHIPKDLNLEDKKHYYHVAITDEIKKFEYVVKRQMSVASVLDE